VKNSVHWLCEVSFLHELVHFLSKVSWGANDLNTFILQELDLGWGITLTLYTIN
jgi:hypothetical protein